MNKKILLTVSLIIVVAAIVTAVALKSNSSNKITEDDNFANMSEIERLGSEALKINGTYVSSDVFDEEYLLFYEKYKNNAEMARKTDEERYDLVLEQVINKIVLDDYFTNKINVTVTDGEVDAYVDKYVKPRYSNSEEQAEYFQRMGFADEKAMKDNIKDYLIKQQVYFEAAKKYGITLTDEERDEAYQTHIKHNVKLDIKNILIAINDNRTKEQAEEIANTVYSKLKAGESFEELAKQYSDDSESKEKGGLTKNLSFGYNPIEFDEAVFNAKEGQLLEPILIPRGYEIVYIEKVKDFTHPKDEYSEIVMVEKFLNSEEYKKWLDSIKQDYDIEVTGPSFNAFRAFSNQNYNEAGELYLQTYEKSKNINYIDRAIEAYSLAENWPELIKVCQIGYKARPDNVIYYVHEAKGIYKNGDQQEGLKKMKAATSKAKGDVFYLGVIRNIYEELGLTDEAQKIKLN